MKNKSTYEKPLTARRVDELFQEAMNEGNLDKALALYDDNAVFVQQPGKPAINGLDISIAAGTLFGKLQAMCEAARQLREEFPKK